MSIFNPFFDLNKQKIINEIKDECSFSPQFFILLILSAAVATLGLIIDNGVVVIGAMLLSPILYPIVGLSLSTVISDKQLLRASIVMALSSILVTIAVASVISLLSPISEFNSEILIRTNPTIFDMIIALSVGIAAILIITWPKFSNHAAGVAVAASLLESLCITGIGLTYGDWSIAYGSFMLFLTNLASVLFAGIVIFAIIGFFKRENEEQRKSLEMGLILSLSVVLLIGLQLIFSLKNILEKNNVESRVRDVFTNEFTKISEDIKVEAINFSGSYKESPIAIESEIKVPSNITINLTQKNQIVEQLTDELKKEIDLELRVIPVLKVVAEEKEKGGKDTIVRKIEKEIIDTVSMISGNIEVESVQAARDEKSRKYLVEVSMRIPEEFDFTPYYKEFLYLSLKKKLDIEVVLELQIIKYSRI